MNKHYTRPLISILPEYSEGIYTASGSNSSGSLTISSGSVLDRWPAGGKTYVVANWSGISGTITLQLRFNDTIDDFDVYEGNVQKGFSGQTVTLTFSSAQASPMTIYLHIDHRTSIDNLKLIRYDYSVQ